MFNVNVRLDITLSSKQTSGGSTDFKIVVGVKIAGSETEGGTWGQLDTPDFRIPAVGHWIPVPTGVILKDGSQNFAFLNTMGLPPQVGATGEIRVFSPGQRDYSSPNLAWRGRGWFQVLEKGANLPLPAAPSTWQMMKRNIWDTVGQGLDWELTTTQGFAFAAGAGGKGGEFLRGSLFVKHMLAPYEERSFTYTGIGGGFMVPGMSASYADQAWPSIGTEITKGNLPISNPLRLEDLQGACQIVDVNFGGIMPTPIPGGRLPAGLGAGVGALGVIFGVPGSLAVGAFKACGWVAGPAALLGKAGGSAGATLNLGYMTLNK
ncbi:MAG TPA: hypothetical protein VKV15_02905 [Bryobacteraceae bacterium]|nr:hypothetical protein [Bryobacteraceae bacterium]